MSIGLFIGLSLLDIGSEHRFPSGVPKGVPEYTSLTWAF
jgi:hypothetical protein